MLKVRSACSVCKLGQTLNEANPIVNPTEVTLQKCYYINLDGATERRIAITNSFAECERTSCDLVRLDACNVDYIIENAIPGKTQPSEKACFISHKMALREAIKALGHAFIVEDDTAFGRATFPRLQGLLQKLDPQSWDLLFTDIGLGNIPDMLSLISLKSALAQHGALRVLPLKGMNYFGSSAYVVNAASKEKLLSLLDEIKTLDHPYDLTLRDLVNQPRIAAYFAFPFLTTISELADISTITHSMNINKRKVLSWNLFRRAI